MLGVLERMVATNGQHTDSGIDNVSWYDTYVYVFAVPKWFRTGTYGACIGARDPAGNSSQRCARVRVS